MKVSQKLFFLFSFVIVQVILIVFLVYDEDQKKATYLQESADRVAIERNATDDYYHDLSMVLFNEIYNQPPVPTLMRKAWHVDEAGRREIRAELYRLLLPTFQRLQENHFRQIHFHLPDGTSFLRMHKPEKFGDNILAARESVRLALAEKRHVRGFETGKLFHAFRHVTPIIVDGELVGSIETSVPFYAFAKWMTSSFAKDYKLLLRKEVIDEKLFDWARSYYAPAPLNPGFVHEKADLEMNSQVKHPGHLAAAVGDEIELAIREQAAPLLPLYQPFALPARAGGKTYVVAFNPLKNIKGDPVGYIYSFTVDHTLAAFRRGSQLTYGLVTSLLLLLLVLTRFALQKIIAHSRFQQTLIDSIPTPVYFKDALRVYLGGNKPFARLFDLAPGDLVGLSDDELLPPSEAERTGSMHKELLRSGGIRSYESSRKTPEGDRNLMEFKTTFADDSDRVVGLIGTIFDITDRKLAEEEVRRMAHFDPLTGLANRALFNDRLDRILAQARRYEQIFSILFIDLDGFKAVNDTYGHEVGDQVLKEVGKRLQDAARQADTVGRMGGDEFTIILIPLKIPEESAIVAERIIASLAQPLVIAENSITIGASIGISVFPVDGQEHKQLLNQADQAMYAAKVAGKNTFLFYGSSKLGSDQVK